MILSDSPTSLAHLMASILSLGLIASIWIGASVVLLMKLM